MGFGELIRFSGYLHTNSQLTATFVVLPVNLLGRTTGFYLGFNIITEYTSSLVLLDLDVVGIYISGHPRVYHIAWIS